jgi:hypothetical protein
MPIVPDDKDWTWVLEKPCGECGFDAGVATFAEIPRLVRHNVKAWLAMFESRTAEELAARPDDSTWSPLEYAAHVRDVYRIMHARLNLMLVLDDPTFPNWDQDVTAESQRYNAQDPEVVQRQLIRAGTAFASAVEDVPLKDVARRGVRGNGSEFTVRTLSVYALHDPVHHLHDVTGQPFALPTPAA